VDNYYSIQEVSERLHLSQKTIRRHIAARRLHAYRIGGVYRIEESALNKFLQKDKGAVEPPYTINLFGEKVILPPKNGGTNGRGKNVDMVNWTDISVSWADPGKSSLTFVDLFSGAGGISKGFEMAGIEALCALDNFDAAAQTFRRNFDHPIIEGDIRDPEVKQSFFDTVKLALKGRKLNIIAGGFPCQGFSLAGHRVVDDPRNSLYLEMLEIVNTLLPDVVLMENVPGLRSMLGGQVERKIIEDYESIGYKVNVTTLRAADYYVPQKRDRVIFICNRRGTSNFHPRPLLGEDQYITTGEAIADLVKVQDNKAFNHVRTRHSDEMKARLAAVPEGKSLYENYSDAWKKCSWNEPSCTIKENHGGVNIHPIEPRVLTAREMARLQSFPDDFIFEGSKSKQLVQIGNAVPPLMAKAIGIAIRKMFGELKSS
jgi:DNA (cytosine-5)-methyltransferase 1